MEGLNSCVQRKLRIVLTQYAKGSIVIQAHTLPSTLNCTCLNKVDYSFCIRISCCYSTFPVVILRMSIYSLLCRYMIRQKQLMLLKIIINNMLISLLIKLIVFFYYKNMENLLSLKEKGSELLHKGDL